MTDKQCAARVHTTFPPRSTTTARVVKLLPRSTPRQRTRRTSSTSWRWREERTVVNEQQTIPEGSRTENLIAELPGGLYNTYHAWICGN